MRCSDGMTPNDTTHSLDPSREREDAAACDSFSLGQRYHPVGACSAHPKETLRLLTTTRREAKPVCQKGKRTCHHLRQLPSFHRNGTHTRA